MNYYQNQETVNLLKKINARLKNDDEFLLNLPLENWPAQQITDKIKDSIMFFKKICEQSNYEGIKHSLLYQEFLKAGIDYLELDYSFEPTVFGQLNESFRWIFQFENDNATKKTLRQVIDYKIAIIDENNAHYNEKSGSLRYSSLLKQEDQVKNVFNLVRAYMPEMENDNTLAVCALILLDLEKMSSSRQYNYLSYEKMYNSSEPLVKWTTCLMIDAVYNKPKLILENNTVSAKGNKTVLTF